MAQDPWVVSDELPWDAQPLWFEDGVATPVPSGFDTSWMDAPLWANSPTAGVDPWLEGNIFNTTPDPTPAPPPAVAPPAPTPEAPLPAVSDIVEVLRGENSVPVDRAVQLLDGLNREQGGLGIPYGTVPELAQGAAVDPAHNLVVGGRTHNPQNLDWDMYYTLLDNSPEERANRGGD